MSEIIPFESGNQAVTEYDDQYFNDNTGLTEGVGGALPVVSIKGGRFAVKYAGERTVITNNDGDPVGSLEAVIVAAKAQVSKIYYENQFSEGDAEAPDCWSLDGEKPDPQSAHPQHSNCAGCPQNQWGSRITDSGKKAKRCQDNRRVAIVPANDIANEAFGGPMLLRVPAASLQDLKKYADGMSAQGFQHAKIVTRIGFDTNVAYPRLTWGAVRPLSAEELGQVVEHFKSGAADGVLEGIGSSVGDHKKAQPTDPKKPANESVSTTFEQPAAPAEPAKEELTPQQKAARTRAAKKAKQKAEQEAAREVVEAEMDDDTSPQGGESSLDDDLNDILAGLDN